MKLTIEKRKYDELLIVEGADNTDILPGTKYFRNFSGLEKRSKNGKVCNSEGRRNFCLALNFPPEVLDEIAGLGIDIVEFASQNTEEYGDEPLRFVRIQISEGGRTPSSLYLLNKKTKKKKPLVGREINLLDSSRFSNVNLVFRTWHRDDGKVSLYLNTAAFELEMNPVESMLAEYDEALGDDFDSDTEELPFR